MNGIVCLKTFVVVQNSSWKGSSGRPCVGVTSTECRSGGDTWRTENCIFMQRNVKTGSRECLRAMAKRVNLVTWSLAVGKGKPQEFSWRVLSGTLTHKMKPVIPSIFISKAFLFSVEGRSRGNQAQNGWKRTFIYSFFSPFFICFSHWKITRQRESQEPRRRFGIPQHDKTYYVKRSCKGAFYGQMFYFFVSFPLFFIQLVSHRTQTHKKLTWNGSNFT